MKAVILCGGRGTRLGKLTENTQKCMLDINGKPFLEHLVCKLNIDDIHSGDITFAVGVHRDQVFKHFDGNDYTFNNYYEGHEDALTFFRDPETTIINGDTLLPDYRYSDPFGMVFRELERGYFQDCGVYGPKYHTFTYYNGPFYEIGTPEGLEKARKELK